MNRVALSTIAALALCVPALAPALAHDHGWPLEDEVTIEAAMDVAYKDGLVLIRSIEFDDGVWEVEGRTADDRSVEIDIDGASGEILGR